MKKILSLISAFITVSLAMGCFVTVSAEESLKSDIYSYTVSGTSAVITGVDDVAGAVTIPEKIGEYTVTAIGKGAFGASAKITEVYIPDTVTSIGDTCFAYSTSIKTVRLPQGITSVSDGMFYQCAALTGISVPYGAARIGENAFAMCPALTAVTIPNSMKEIADNAFANSPNVRIHCYLSDTGVGYQYATAHELPTEELITVYVNGNEIAFDQPPITDPKRFRTLIPLRGVLEEMGAEIEWYNDMNYAGITLNGNRILFKPESEYMRVNGRTQYLSTPGIMFNDRVLIPVRDIVEAVGGKIVWDEHNKIVYVTYEA